jgi:uncharacterized protein with PhoU and TrkA domain
MSLLENLKKNLKDGSEKVVKIAEDITEKIREVGEEGLELSKEMIAEISEKTSDITNIARYKLDLNEMQKKLDSEMKNLGEIVFTINSSKKRRNHEEKIHTQIEKIANLKKDMRIKTNTYENLRKEYSNNFVIQKFSEELAESDAIIEQVHVSEKSISINKTLKELLLPKEALISAIKRDDEVIIPDGNTKILVDDIITIIGKKNDVQKVKNKFKIK